MESRKSGPRFSRIGEDLKSGRKSVDQRIIILKEKYAVSGRIQQCHVPFAVDLEDMRDTDQGFRAMVG